MERRWQQTFRTVLLVVAVVAALALVGIRARVLYPLVRATFPTILLLAITPTLFWWAWLDELCARSARRWAPLFRGIVGFYVACLIAPIAVLLFGWHSYDLLPVPVLMWVMAWYVLMAVTGLLGLVFWLPYLGLRTLRRALIPKRQRVVPAPIAAMPGNAGVACNEAEVVPASTGLSRRALLSGALAAAPVMLVGSAVASGLRQQGRFVVRRIEMRLPRLPDRLRGLTITQVSDLHVGRLFRPDHLPPLVDAVNRLDSDLIAITGDIVDHSADFFPPACEAFRQMQSRCGRFLVIGNHDLIDSPALARKALRQFGTSFLEDERRVLDIGGERLQLVGLDWSRHDRPHSGLPGHEERVHEAMAKADPSLFTLALVHHPHAFDALADAGADLTLAGHTHGGQLMLTPQGFPHPVGGGLLFRYIWGEYRRGDAALYVTSGAGNWFPVRINAPAEIVQIRLV